MKLSILGTRGIPARHGGFETFAEQLAVYLTEAGHEVTVYCQDEQNPVPHTDFWRGIRRIHLYGSTGPLGTMVFDWKCVGHSLREKGVLLTLGYNTAIFSLLYRFGAYINLMNMDGIEWKRQKWSLSQRLWLRFNEFAGARLSRHLIADHPEIARHLEWATTRDKITVIPYGAEAVYEADPVHLQPFGLTPGNYGLVIARPEPENSILEIVQAYSFRPRGVPLVVLGKYRPEENAYHREVMEQAGNEVLFPGAIYDSTVVQALRFFARAYFHGHRVGGTNPSLVEALAAGNPIIAHDNCFTRWVAGEHACFFSGKEDLALVLDDVFEDKAKLATLAAASRRRHAEAFTQEHIMRQYETLLVRFSAKEVHGSVPAGETAAMKKAG